MSVARSRTMATWPFQKTRSPRCSAARTGGQRDRRAERRFLHIAVARAGNACRRQRHLHQPRAIETERRLAAPQIRHAEKALGHGDEIRSRRYQAARDAATARRRRTASPPCDPRCGRWQGARRAAAPRCGGSLIDGPGNAKRPQRRYFVGRRRAGRRQRVRRQPADIAVGRELAPGPAFGIRCRKS